MNLFYNMLPLCWNPRSVNIYHSDPMTPAAALLSNEQSRAFWGAKTSCGQFWESLVEMWLLQPPPHRPGPQQPRLARLFVYMWKGRPQTQHSSVRGRDESSYWNASHPLYGPLKPVERFDSLGSSLCVMARKGLHDAACIKCFVCQFILKISGGDKEHDFHWIVLPHSSVSHTLVRLRYSDFITWDIGLVGDKRQKYYNFKPWAATWIWNPGMKA